MIEGQKINQNGKQEKAILVGVCSQGMSFDQAKEYLHELAFLTETAGGKAVASYIQKLDKPLNSTYVGSGKLEEIKEAVNAMDADLVVFDDDLSPTQMRNLDKALEVKVLDRSTLILHIFSERAQTAQARVQVDLAQYQYLLPRLTGMWTHLGRQRGGIGLKGAGEKEIETDRRIIRNRITKLKADLERIDRQGKTRRKNRSEFARIALVGYTNVGKSSLMNILSKSTVIAENKLFATLDTTVRKVSLMGIPFLLSDTVGFIRKLPHHLIESFKSTLAEAGESDLLLHVVDASHPHFQDHMLVVNETLRDLHFENKRVLTVFNKIDLLDEEERENLEKTWFAREKSPAIAVSAAAKINLAKLRSRITEMLVEIYTDKSTNGEHHFLQQHAYFTMAEEEDSLPSSTSEN